MTILHAHQITSHMICLRRLSCGASALGSRMEPECLTDDFGAINSAVARVFNENRLEWAFCVRKIRTRMSNDKKKKCEGLNILWVDGIETCIRMLFFRLLCLLQLSAFQD